MITTIIKQLFILYTSFYLYKKLLNISTPRLPLLEFFSSIFLSIISYYFATYIPCLIVTFSILIFFFIVQIFFHISPKLSFVTTMISFGLSYGIFSICSFEIIIILYWLYNNKTVFPLLLVTILSGILTLINVHILFHFKRFRHSMRFLYQDQIINSGVFISIAILLGLTIWKAIYIPPNFSRIIPTLFIFILGFLLLFWWKNQITKSYLEKIRKAELESLRQEVIDKDAEIQKLRENNDSLAHIIHRDNKLIPAMETAVCEFLEDYALLSADDFRARGQSLANELKEMSASRTGILTEYQAKGQHIPITGVCSVDALFSYMQKKASSFEITLEAKVSTDLLSFTGKVISPDDLSHLLSDLIENAIIATKNSPLRKIQVHIGFISNHYVVEILDTGEAFPIEILQGFGIEQKTSHAGEGGSGIGLMDIWKLKKKYRASLHIQEFPSDNGSFQKKISLIFDSKNHYLIQTYRPQEILMTLKRSDLYVLENET